MKIEHRDLRIDTSLLLFPQPLVRMILATGKRGTVGDLP
jgi:hypothetical protein